MPKIYLIRVLFEIDPTTHERKFKRLLLEVNPSEPPIPPAYATMGEESTYWTTSTSKIEERIIITKNPHVMTHHLQDLSRVNL